MMMIRVERWFPTAALAAILVVAASACAAGDASQSDAENSAVGEIATAKSGTDASYDPTAVRKRVLDLYVTRQEYIEMYWGPGGKLTSGAALGAAIETAEARFHDLMGMMGGTPPPPASGVVEAAAAVIDAHLVVLEEARAAGVSLDPSAADSMIEGTPAGGLADWIADVREGLENLPLASTAAASGS